MMGTACKVACPYASKSHIQSLTLPHSFQAKASSFT